MGLRPSGSPARYRSPLWLTLPAWGGAPLASSRPRHPPAGPSDSRSPLGCARKRAPPASSTGTPRPGGLAPLRSSLSLRSSSSGNMPPRVDAPIRGGALKGAIRRSEPRSLSTPAGSAHPQAGVLSVLTLASLGLSLRPRPSQCRVACCARFARCAHHPAPIHPFPSTPEIFLPTLPMYHPKILRPQGLCSSYPARNFSDGRVLPNVDGWRIARDTGKKWVGSPNLPGPF